MSRKEAEARSQAFVPRTPSPRRTEDRSGEHGSSSPEDLEERDEDGRFKNWPVAGTVCD